jgi:hypothetical protein
MRRTLAFVAPAIVLMFSAAHAQWVPIDSPVNHPQRESHSCCWDPVNDRIYMLGGALFPGGEATNLCQRYDPDSNTWTDMAPMISPRYLFKGVYCRGKLYAMGGKTDSCNVIDSCEAYDIATNTWALIASLPSPISRHQAVVWRDSLVYVLGGYSSTRVWVYNTFTDVWSSASEMPIECEYSDACVIGDTIYFAGGWVRARGAGDSAMRVGVIDSASPLNITWSWGPRLPASRSFGPVVAMDGKVYWFGGLDDPPVATRRGYVYDPMSEGIGRIPDYPVSVGYCCLGVARDSSMQIFGLAGKDDNWVPRGYYRLDLTDYDNVAVARMVEPAPRVDSGDTVIPTVLVENFGAHARSFRVMFRIDDHYTEFDSADLEPGRSAYLSFPGWQATQNGYHFAGCSLLTDDDQPADDVISDSFFVYVGGDVGVSRLIAPTAEIDSGDTFTPIAMVKNYGNRAKRCQIMFGIRDFQTIYEDVSVQPGESTLKVFATWNARVIRGFRTVVCSTMLRNDEDSANDAKTGRIRVRVFDAGLTRLVLPDTIPVGDFFPAAAVYNRGTEPVWLRTDWQMMLDDTLEVYNRSKSEEIPAGGSPLMIFPAWQATTGGYLAKTWVSYEGRVLGDTLRKHFLVVGEGVEDATSQPILRTRIASIFPSPLNSRARIDFEVKGQDRVSLRVHDVTGRARVVLARDVAGPGRYSVRLETRRPGKEIPPGVYFLSLEARGHRESRKLVVER